VVSTPLKNIVSWDDPGSRAESTVHGPLPGGEKVRSETSQLFERSFAGFIMYIK